MSIEGKVVVITGAGSGIGAATARLFAAAGARVVVTDIDEESGRTIAAEIESEFLPLDVRSSSAVAELITQVIKQYGQLDVMINNAGIANKHMVKTADHSLDDWDQVLAVNQSGVFYCMKYALRQMIQQGHGNIVNVASLAGLKASGRNLAYSASKFAVVGMTKSAALEYAAKNIRINCVCPGYTQSALLEKVFQADPSMRDKLLRYIPMRRYGHAEEIAEAILWLASDKTSFMTGQALGLDGGLSL